MKGYIDGVDFIHLEAERYWTFPSTYKGNKKEEMLHMIRDGQYVGSEKKDGIYERFVKDEDGNCFLIARNENVKGEMTNKIDHVPQLMDFFYSLPNGTCLLGELYFPNNPGSRKVTTIMGCLTEKAISRQKEEKLHYYIFDVWATHDKSCLNTVVEDRIKELELLQSFNEDYVEFAKYYCGEALEKELIRVRDNNGEGIVITKFGTVPSPGKRTARKTLKIKTELDSPVDCFLTGKYKPATRQYKGKLPEEWNYWENVMNNSLMEGNHYKEYATGATIEPVSKAYFYGWASAVELGMVDKDGKVVGVGWVSGVSDEVKQGIVDDPENWKYKVIKVNAMSIEPDTHKFRHARIVEWRNDKNWKDCEVTQLWDE